MVQTSAEKNPNEMGDKAENQSPKKQPKQRTGKGLNCEVVLLDGEQKTFELDRNAEGRDLLEKVCQHLDLIEKDYFGIQFVDDRISKHMKCWLSPDKKITKQKKGGPWLFDFALKFYPPDPTQLRESLTRWLVVLQTRRDILSGKLPTTFLTQAMLGSYCVQADVGDFDHDKHIGINYIRDTSFAPNQTADLLGKITELHKQHKGQTPDEAENNFLENAKKLSMYGVDLHAAQDANDVDIMLGVCASGLQVYRDKLRISRFVWPKILKICYKRRHFYVKVRPTENMPTENTFSFKLASHRLAKRLWKICVEHHAFFRLREAEQSQNPAMFPRLGSKFRYSGRTLYQTRQNSQILDRPDPYFERSQPARNTFAAPTTRSRSVDELSNRPDYWNDGDDEKGQDGRDKKDLKDDPYATVTKAGREGTKPLGSEDGGTLEPGANKSMDGRDRLDHKPGDDQWKPLQMFFEEECKKDIKGKSEEEKKRSSIRTRVHDFLKRSTAKLYALFLSFAMESFDILNQELQTDAAKIHVVKRSLEQFYRKLLISFVKPSALSSGTLLAVDFTAKYNMKDSKDILIGTATKQHISGLRDKVAEQFMKDVISFYQAACTYLKAKVFPVGEPLWKHAQVADIKLKETALFSSLDYFMERFPCLLPHEVGEDESPQEALTRAKDQLQAEFTDYQSWEVPSHLMTEEKVATEQLWAQITKVKDCNEAMRFQVLPRVMLGILLLPDATLTREGAQGTAGLTSAELQKKAKEEEKERKKREKEEEKRRKKEEEERKKAEKAAAKKGGKGKDPLAEDGKDALAGKDNTEKAPGWTPGSHGDHEGTGTKGTPAEGRGILTELVHNLEHSKTGQEKVARVLVDLLPSMAVAVVVNRDRVGVRYNTLTIVTRMGDLLQAKVKTEKPLLTETDTTGVREGMEMTETGLVPREMGAEN
ncbi:hypothetical protein ACOMHN_061303 [Nucella lapillus]